MAGKCAPILVLGTQEDFSLYTCEILKAEGFNAYDVRLLPQCDLSLGRFTGVRCCPAWSLPNFQKSSAGIWKSM